MNSTMDIRKGDMVQFRTGDTYSYGKVDSIARTNDGEVIAYYVIPHEGGENLWIDCDDAVSYAAFGPIPSVEKVL
jgi:hypothetical protein